MKNHNSPVVFLRLSSATFSPSCEQASFAASGLAAELGFGLARIYQLRTGYLRACAEGRAGIWQPGFRAAIISRTGRPDAVALATRLLSSSPRSSYSAVASELLRRLGFKTNRASVRRWAIAHNLAPDTRYKKPAKPVRRWQARDFGALWQYDATPHAWLPGIPTNRPSSTSSTTPPA